MHSKTITMIGLDVICHHIKILHNYWLHSLCFPFHTVTFILYLLISLTYFSPPSPISPLTTTFCSLYPYSISIWFRSVQFSSFQSLSRAQLFVTPWIIACQASLSITNSRNSLRLTSIESVMPSSHLILCCPLLLSTYKWNYTVLFPCLTCFT